MAGFGTPDPWHRNAYAVTIATHNLSYKLRETRNVVPNDAHSEDSQGHRFARQVYSCSEPVPVDTFSFDMLRRASAAADGNVFSNPTMPAAPSITMAPRINTRMRRPTPSSPWRGSTSFRRTPSPRPCSA